MPRRNALLPALLLTLLAGLSACAAAQPRPGVSPDRAEAQTLVRDAAATLRDMRAASPHRALDHWLEDASGVVVLPGLYRAGFLYSVQGGHGVLLARRADGSWSPPAFVASAGAGVGVQAGLERMRLVLVLLTPEAVGQVLAGGPEFGTGAMFDVLGVREQTGPESRTRNAPAVGFADGVGLMAGVGLRLGGLGQYRTLNAAYHGPDASEGAAVLRGESIPGLEVLELWEALRAETDGKAADAPRQAARP